MRHILNIFKRKNKGSQEPKQRIKEIIGLSGIRYSPYFFKIKMRYIVDKKTDKIVDILRGVK